MAVLNVTPDSFSDGGRLMAAKKRAALAESGGSGRAIGGGAPLGGREAGQHARFRRESRTVPRWLRQGWQQQRSTTRNCSSKAQAGQSAIESHSAAALPARADSRDCCGDLPSTAALTRDYKAYMSANCFVSHQ